MLLVWLLDLISQPVHWFTTFCSDNCYTPCSALGEYQNALQGLYNWSVTFYLCDSSDAVNSTDERNIISVWKFILMMIFSLLISIELENSRHSSYGIVHVLSRAGVNFTNNQSFISVFFFFFLKIHYVTELCETWLPCKRKVVKEETHHPRMFARG